MPGIINSLNKKLIINDSLVGGNADTTGDLKEHLTETNHQDTAETNHQDVAGVFLTGGQSLGNLTKLHTWDPRQCNYTPGITDNAICLIAFRRGDITFRFSVKLLFLWSNYTGM